MPGQGADTKRDYNFFRGSMTGRLHAKGKVETLAPMALFAMAFHGYKEDI